MRFIGMITSTEYLTIRTFDGRVVRVSVATQTDWEHEEERSQDDERPNRETSKAPQNNLELTSEQSVPKNMKSKLEISPDNEALDSLSKETPQTPAACQGETEESSTNLDKIPFSRGSQSAKGPPQTVKNIRRQLLKKPPVTSDQIANSVGPEETAWKSSEILEGAAVITKKPVTDRDLAKQKDHRLKGLQVESSSDHPTPKAGNTQHVSVVLHDQSRVFSILNFVIVDLKSTFSFNGNNSGAKRTTPLVKHYNNGQTFLVIFPDGAGQVRYPSGRLAILLSAEPGCVVALEDKQLQPHIQALFTSRGQGTCYHNNGCIWVNLTPRGGTYWSDTGDLKKQWGWLDNQCHAHAPPYQPLRLTLSPNIKIHIQSQEHIGITFTSGKRTVQLNVGAKLKSNQDIGLTLPGPDTLQKYRQQKSAEIDVLLQNIQSLTNYQKNVNPWKVKPQQRPVSQMERRKLPVNQHQPAKETP
ncbi:hypothetical protein VZT92_005279 [Zoarces viviparus]|uniref:FAM194 C-terminal domain-containing protein n=1 Tax=Zoarces viviparus TaxID=48416 RepID=A0AAW1FSJ9_ZOAVI